MRIVYKSLLTISLLSTVVYGQEISRPQKIQELQNLASKIEQMQNQIVKGKWKIVKGK